MRPLTKSEQRIMVCVTASPHGLRRREVANAIGLKPGRTGELLRALRDLGLVAPTSLGGRSARWALKSTADAIRSERDRVSAAERARVAEAKRRAQIKARQQQIDAAANEEFLRQRRVVRPVSACAPMRPSGPTSVFNLGA